MSDQRLVQALMVDATDTGRNFFVPIAGKDRTDDQRLTCFNNVGNSELMSADCRYSIRVGDWE